MTLYAVTDASLWKGGAVDLLGHRENKQTVDCARPVKFSYIGHSKDCKVAFYTAV